MPPELPNRFDFSTRCPEIYQTWLAGNYFHPRVDPQRQPFTIVIPPPNVTGALHLGHALNNTLQDTVIRLKRMQGYNALWIPGTDHAGIATQAVVERRLKQEEGKTRHDLGREELVRRIWQWKDQYETRIIEQLQRIGCSCDWQRLRFTLDEICAKAVRRTFFDLFRKQWIYRGKRLVNWDTFLQTAVSDDEVFNDTVKGYFYHLRYPVIDPKPGEPTHVVVATTRPETMLGDTAVAVHPDPRAALAKSIEALNQRLAQTTGNERTSLQKQLEQLRQRTEELPRLEQLRDMAQQGRQLMLPLLDRPIPLIIDSWAKPDMGSGCVKITPAHDPNDYLVGQRHNLPMINVMNFDGTLNDQAGPYAAMTIAKARETVVKDLETFDLIGSIEQRDIELPFSDRSKTPIEPMLADQWFVAMEQLAQSAIDAVANGQVEIVPSRYAKTYHDWLSEKRDWPVSRQLAWGHRIPVWSRMVQDAKELEELQRELVDKLKINDTSASIQVEQLPVPESSFDQTALVHVCIEREGDPLEQLLEQIGFKRENDVLDTWFSSALWPHSTLGWPAATDNLAYFYPTSLLITSRDIITLWVARMVMMGLNNTRKVPFEQVFIHPKILDGYGETMSKSKGNGVDPIDVVDKFGPDALRFALVALTTETQDVRMAVQFECPHCETLVEQTKQNRQQPVIRCKSCLKDFRTQWAESDEHLRLPRGPVVSDRFEQARNFANKLWNAARFSLMNLDGYQPRPLTSDQLRLEDHWILSRLATVTQRVTEALDRYQFAEASKELYEFAWDQFCSFYVEMLKDRFTDPQQRPVAQQILAHTLDQLLRLLHPIMPFITEEMWRLLGYAAPERGVTNPAAPSLHLVVAQWPRPDASHINHAIEGQFARFQQVLTALRDIRAKQNVPTKQPIRFAVHCARDQAALMHQMQPYFASMATATLTEAGPDVAPAGVNATITLGDMRVHVDLEGLIDVQAEVDRLRTQRSKLHSMIEGKQRKLANEDFVQRAPADIVQREREGLEQLQQELQTIDAALESLIVAQ